jgi:hypothetical protein
MGKRFEQKRFQPLQRLHCLQYLQGCVRWVLPFSEGEVLAHLVLHSTQPDSTGDLAVLVEAGRAESPAAPTR